MDSSRSPNPYDTRSAHLPRLVPGVVCAGRGVAGPQWQVEFKVGLERSSDDGQRARSLLKSLLVKRILATFDADRGGECSGGAFPKKLNHRQLHHDFAGWSRHAHTANSTRN